MITMKSRLLAPQKEFESPTFRLGGGRSILLSYWGICLCIIVAEALASVKTGKREEFFCRPTLQNTIFRI